MNPSADWGTSHRLAKYDQFLRIEQALGKNAVYAGRTALPKARR